MSQGILQTALTNKTLRLEFEYRKPSTQQEDESTFASEMPCFHPSMSEEFAELLGAI